MATKKAPGRLRPAEPGDVSDLSGSNVAEIKGLPANSQVAIDTDTIRLCRVIIAARDAGASLRGLARCLGWSKSSLHRYLSQMDQLEALDPAFSKAIREGLVPSGTDDRPVAALDEAAP